MKTFKQLKETVEAPRSEAERNFIKKHVVQVIDNTQGKIETKVTKDKTRKADYKDGEDALVYEDIDSLVSEALLEGINFKVGAHKFDDGTSRVITRGDLENLEKVYNSAVDKLGVEKASKSSRDEFEKLIALGD
jgi:hypothetical protein